MAENETEDALPEPDAPAPGGRGLAAVAGAVPVVLGAAAAWLSLRLDIGTLTDPGPGLWPLIVSALLVATGIGILVSARRAGGTEAFTRGAISVAAAAVALFAYASLFEVVGFEIPTLLLLAAWLRFLGRESWLSTALLSVGVTAAAYALFILGLGVPLPHLIVL
ncbi:Tripartite tricarboxylate transporter TctB family protein [Glycomyces harbinensis]|uniref:Tripartite tricarboxylate transporter TctB family protein n=2 Tax=Glycomyces harbinensis TaxID=58114 RepID=A0A1G6XFD2_9ACTN|nr:Tripartite tricarboxylate transporter TctB family protein [Glycomyces harbinensis]